MRRKLRLTFQMDGAPIRRANPFPLPTFNRTSTELTDKYRLGKAVVPLAEDAPAR